MADTTAKVIDLFQVSPGFHDRAGNARLTFYVEQTDDESGRCDKIVNARLIIPQSALPAMVNLLMAALTPEGRKYAEAWHMGVTAHA